MVPLDKIPVTGEWECMECGYVEEGMEARKPLKCPECHAPTSALEFFPYEDESNGDGEWEADALEEEFDEDFDEDTDEDDER